MIIQEKIVINNKEFLRTYSDSNLKIKKIDTNEVYDEAIDLITSNFSYEESNLEIDNLEI